MKVFHDKFPLILLILFGAAVLVQIRPLYASFNLSTSSLFGKNESINSIGLQARGPIFDPGTGLLSVRLRLDFYDNMIFSEVGYDTTLTGITDIKAYSLDQYINDGWKEGLKNTWIKVTSKNLVHQVTQDGEDQGLLPDIHLPVDIPKPIAAVIGRGGGLKVKGSNKISFGGTTTFLDPEPANEVRRTSHFPSLEMDQILKVNVEGTVGDKIHVFVDHDSEREFQTKNQVRVRYEGDEDEIVQEIELGDTQLSLPGSKFISGTVPSQGLFGAKAKGKLGNLDFSLVASKQEHKLEKKSFQGQSSQDSLLIRDFNFQKNYHFSLVGVLQDFLATGDSSMTPKRETIKIWVDDLNGTNNDGGSEGTGGAVQAYARIDPNDPSVGQDEEWFGYFDLQRDGTDYTLDPSNLVVDFSRAIQENEVIAVSYETVGGTKVGDLSQEPYTLKLIKPSEVDTTSMTWNYQLRNQYYLGSTDIIESSLDVEIYKGDDRNPIYDEEVSGVKRTYLNIFGLDDDSDGKIELSHVDFERGLLIFPDLQPFYEPGKERGTTEAIGDTNRAMYYNDSPVNLGLENNVYSIMVRYRSRTTSFNLGVLNVMEGSEHVTVNGKTLQRGVDYEMIYEIGQIIFYNPDILANDAKINIGYEYAPLFAQSQVTMVGLRGDYQVRKDSKVSTTWLVQSEKSIDQRPRLGDESKRMVVGEVDGNIGLKPNVMTSMANALPLVETDALSKLDLNGEVAVSLPNPNTQGEVFIDDFEGSSLIDTYSMSRRAWKLSSPPAGAGLEPSEGGGLIWYNPPLGTVLKKDLNPNVPPDEQNKPVTVLTLDFTPASTVFPEDSWRSLVQPISNSGLDFTEKKFLDIWLHGSGGEIWFEIGTVSEDALRFDAAGNVLSPDGLLDTEDLNRDGKLDFNEDIGLDGIAGDDALWSVGSGDDGNDDFRFTDSDRSSGNYSMINGTEGNSFLDTEDLNGDNTLETDEKVFRYKIDLDNPDPRVKIISENTATGWKLYQIPIKDDSLYTSYGDPDFRRIKHLRVVLTGFSGESNLMIGSIEVEGNSWLERGIRNRSGGPVDPITEKFAVSVKNKNDNGDYFSPPGVVPQQVSGLPSGLQVINEQSLSLSYENLDSGHIGLAVQPLLTPQSYIDYRSISFWVRRNSGVAEDPHLFLQVGTDSLNYYEYSFSPTSAWQEVVVPFQALTDVKKEALDALSAGDNPADIDVISGNIRVRGTPTLTNIRRLAIGVDNESADPVTGEIWVDELRLTDVIRDRGLARRVGMSADFADVGGVNVDYEARGDQFRQLNQKRTNLSKRDINFNASLNVDKFAPASLGLAIPLTYTRSQGKSLPRYRTGSDIVFHREADQEQERTEHFRETVKIGYSKKKASLNPLLRATVDKITGSFSTSSTEDLSPITRSNKRRDNLQVRYNTPFEGDYDFPLFPSSLFGFLRHLPLPSLVKKSSLVEGLKTSRFRYLPGNLSLGGRIDRSNSLGINSRSGVRTPYRTFYSTGEVVIKHRPLRSLSGTYQLQVVRDLDQRRVNDIFGILSINTGTEINRRQTLQYTYSPEVLSWLSPSYSFNTRYVEDHTPQVSRTVSDSLDVRKFNNNTQRDLTVNLGLPKLFAAMSGGVAGKVSGKVTHVGGRGVKREKAKVEKASVSAWRRGMGRASRMFKNVTFRLGRDNMTDYQYVTIKPPLLYQLGLKELDLEPRQRRKTRDLSVDGGMSLPVGISINSGYAEKHSENVFRGSSNFSSSITWPKVGLDIPSLRIPMSIRRYLTAVSLNSQYSKSRQVSGTGSNGVESSARGVSWTPFLSLSSQYKNGLTATYSFTRGETRTLNFTGSGNTSLKENGGHQLNLNYSLRTRKGFGLPVPGLSKKKIRWKSALKLQLSFSRNSSREVVLHEGGADTEIVNNVTTTIEPSADYDFSRITTGLRFNYNVVNNRKSGQRTITIGANVWMQFLF